MFPTEVLFVSKKNYSMNMPPVSVGCLRGGFGSFFTRLSWSPLCDHSSCHVFSPTVTMGHPSCGLFLRQSPPCVPASFETLLPAVPWRRLKNHWFLVWGKEVGRSATHPCHPSLIGLPQPRPPLHIPTCATCCNEVAVAHTVIC